jgi:hypothetical protein
VSNLNLLKYQKSVCVKSAKISKICLCQIIWHKQIFDILADLYFTQTECYILADLDLTQTDFNILADLDFTHT